ncbi:P-loop containing nucleoside triphosphate hydrolase protein [Melampsora americana]|nr:P-loop containing nucleoside triphosphate hydrolase protein [Melampsora americana]
MAPLTRSKSTGHLPSAQQSKLATPHSKGPEILKQIADADDNQKKCIIEQMFIQRYNLLPRDLQVQCVLLLLAGWNTFLLASTGFGKSKFPEMYLMAFDQAAKPMVLILNPLDALGDNQVAEKVKDGFTAVSLTQKTFTDNVYHGIMRGVYQFIYLSLEIFLNSPLFTKLYFNPLFQNCLILKVVDEAHLIYYWGVVANGDAQQMSSFKNLQDMGVFRPTYGNLFGRFLATDHAPILLMSATCRPKAIDAIKKNLRLGEHNLKLRTAELVHTEIRLIRLNMHHTLKSAKDLERFFGLASFIPDVNIPPTLIYSGSQNATGDTLWRINEARGQPENSCNGYSSFARRYHAGTGPDDKVERAEHFVGQLFAVICCTMALGLGQNWKIMRRVIVMGRMDPAAVAQMFGRCGRDGRPGVGVLLVEERRRGAKNPPKEFGNVDGMLHDDRMDALAETPVCLRAAMAVDNYIGHIPVSFQDPHYVKELARQQAEGFAPCLCSNCEPEMAQEFVNAQHHATKDNFSDIILGTHLSSITHELCCTPANTSIKPNLKSIMTCPPSDKAQSMPIMKYLVNTIVAAVDELYNLEDEDGEFVIDRRTIFNLEEHAWPIVKNAGIIAQGVSLRMILGSESIDGMFKLLLQCISDWQNSEFYQNHLNNINHLARLRVSASAKKVERQLARLLNTSSKRTAEVAQLDVTRDLEVSASTGPLITHGRFEEPAQRSNAVEDPPNISYQQQFQNMSNHPKSMIQTTFHSQPGLYKQHQPPNTDLLHRQLAQPIAHQSDMLHREVTRPIPPHSDPHANQERRTLQPNLIHNPRGFDSIPINYQSCLYQEPISHSQNHTHAHHNVQYLDRSTSPLQTYHREPQDLSKSFVPPNLPSQIPQPYAHGAYGYNFGNLQQTNNSNVQQDSLQHDPLSTFPPGNILRMPLQANQNNLEIHWSGYSPKRNSSSASGMPCADPVLIKLGLHSGCFDVFIEV